ncbi:MAG: alpha/beta fold hydrolase [Burkholderiaceae bacterium]
MTLHLSRRRWLLTATAATGLALSGCGHLGTSGLPSADAYPPIVFVHGNGDSAALWQTTLWRFESNGWPRERLHAIDLPYPLARDEDAKPQAGRTSTQEHMEFLRSEVQQVLDRTGAKQVVLVGNSRGGNAIRNYIYNGGGAAQVSHAVLGGTPNHGVWAVPGWREGNEFSGTGPFLRGLNAPKNAAGDEVTGPVRWMTIRSDHNDKFAQPDGLWIGQKGMATNVTAAGPELKGATNVVIAGIDHRETSYSPAAFEATYRFITGRAPQHRDTVPQSAPVVIDGKVTGLGVNPLDPATGSFSNNLPVPGATVSVFAVDPATGARRGEPLGRKTVAADGRWGPVTVPVNAPVEFEVAAPGYATTHIYRSGFPRSSNIVHLRAERLAATDRDADAVVTLTRPRGYLDPQRDPMRLDGAAPAGVPPGAGVASAKIKPTGPQRTVRAEFHSEVVVGQTWAARDNRVVLLEITR